MKEDNDYIKILLFDKNQLWQQTRRVINEGKKASRNKNIDKQSIKESRPGLIGENYWVLYSKPRQKITYFAVDPKREKKKEEEIYPNTQSLR